MSKAKGRMVSMTDEFHEKVMKIAYETTGSTNISAFFRWLVEEYEKRNQ